MDPAVAWSGVLKYPLSRRRDDIKRGKGKAGVGLGSKQAIERSSNATEGVAIAMVAQL